MASPAFQHLRCRRSPEIASVGPNRTTGADATPRVPLFRICYPRSCVAVILEARCVLQRVLRGVHHCVPLVVILRLELHSLERDSDVLLASAEDPADGDDKCN